MSLVICTVLVLRMAHRKWKEAKQQPGTAEPGNMLGCCLNSFHFLWAILSTSTVLYLNHSPQEPRTESCRKALLTVIREISVTRAKGKEDALSLLAAKFTFRCAPIVHMSIVVFQLCGAAFPFLFNDVQCSCSGWKWKKFRSAVLGCCLVSFHFLWAILSTSTVLYF